MRRLWLCTLLSIGACWGGDDEQPGQPVGVFEATGLMVEQSCGAAIPASDPLDLDFQLRNEDGGRAYWQSPGGPVFAGVQNGDEFTFTTTRSWMVIEPDRFQGYVGCSVTQRDTFTFVVEEVATEGDASLDAAPADGETTVAPALYTMSGSQTTNIVPINGSDCTPAVAALGGPFLALPCRVEYVLTGSGISTAPPQTETEPESEER
jgi:hypothetical protein